jgi:hypothetical protein
VELLVGLRENSFGGQARATRDLRIRGKADRSCFPQRAWHANTSERSLGITKAEHLEVSGLAAGTLVYDGLLAVGKDTRV